MHIPKSGVTKQEAITALEAELKAAGGTVPKRPPGSKTAHIETLEKLITETKTARAATSAHERKMKARAAEKTAEAEPDDIITRFKSIEDPAEKSAFYQAHKLEIFRASRA